MSWQPNEKANMVQNAGGVLKNGQKMKRARREKGAN